MRVDVNKFLDVNILFFYCFEVMYICLRLSVILWIVGLLLGFVSIYFLVISVVLYVYFRGKLFLSSGFIYFWILVLGFLLENMVVIILGNIVFLIVFLLGFCWSFMVFCFESIFNKIMLKV